jgi:uncharacterized protein (TIGR04255 family)
MPITLKNSPIVELIAEIRWDINSHPVAGAPSGTSMGIVPNPAELEAFFMRFIGPAHQAGYPQIERLVPSGFPLFAYQPVFRFRPQDGKGLLLQVGPGILTVNATPPYKTWDDFAPEIRKGLDALFAARDKFENECPFSSLSLRYIDAFNESMTQRLDIANFLSEIFNIKVLLPTAITKHARPGSVIKPSLQIQVPMPDDRMLSLGIGEGIANNQPAFVMDTTISLLQPTAPIIDEVMRELASARSVIHEMFFEFTAPILDLMQPAGVN